MAERFTHLCRKDTIYWKKGKFLTLVYQINEGMKRLLFVVEDRREANLCQFFAWFGKERSALITFVCSDMGKPYLNVIARHAPQCPEHPGPLSHRRQDE